MKAAAIHSGKEITTSQAAKMLNISHDTVTRLVESGDIEARRLPNGWWRIRYDSVIDYREKIQQPS